MKEMFSCHEPATGCWDGTVRLSDRYFSKADYDEYFNPEVISYEQVNSGEGNLTFSCLLREKQHELKQRIADGYGEYHGPDFLSYELDIMVEVRNSQNQICCDEFYELGDGVNVILYDMFENKYTWGTLNVDGLTEYEFELYEDDFGINQQGQACGRFTIDGLEGVFILDCDTEEIVVFCIDSELRELTDYFLGDIVNAVKSYVEQNQMREACFDRNGR